ncbi:WD repeat-containing protein 75 [Entophlyctis sp. JEL0112]|nr:WD repeat-containing protein 75 [Entophlyctis sp. JEL0112]
MVVVTTIAAHPLNQSVAIGLTTGEILLHHNPFDAVKSVLTLHWHAHAVLSLEFTNDGTTLASGGYESVLILWQIDTLKRKPVPRIAGGAALQSIACSSDDASLAVVCSDSCVRVISIPKLQVVACVTGLKARNGRVFSYHEGLAYDPRTASVVVSGSPGCIQFYNPHTQSHIMELEVVAQNRMVGGGFSGKDGVDKIVGEDSLATVKMVAFENDGRKSRWMATVDVRTDMAVADEEEVWLKFWQWDDVNQTSGKFQFPCEVFVDDNYISGHPIQSISSSDASMIATACGSVITLWDPVTNALWIPSSSNGESQTTEIPCIVGLTKERCHVWNLLTASIWWTLELGGAMIATASDADTGQFAIAVAEVSPSGSVQRTKILEFIVSSPAPTSSFFIKGELQGMLYIPSAQMPAGSSRSTSDRLFVLSADFEIERLGSGRSPGTSTATKAEAQDLDKSTGLLTGIYGSKVLDAPISQTSANRKPNSSANTIRSDSEKSLAFMQTTACHLLPPPVKLADAFFEAILRKKESLSDEPILWTHEVEIKADESAMVIDRDIAPQNTSPDEDSLNGMEYLADVMTGLVLGKGKTLDELPASTKTPEKSKDAKVKREKVGSSSKKK